MITLQRRNESPTTSPNEASGLFNSDLLVEVAPAACAEILTCARKKKPLPSVPGSQIGTALHLIARHLEAAQPYQLPDTTQDLSYRVLRDLLKFCKWPARSVASGDEDHEAVNSWLPLPTSRSICDELKTLFSLQQAEMRSGITSFLAAKQTDVEFYANRFQELLNLLDPHNRRLGTIGQSSLYVRHLKPHAEYVYPDDIRENLITALKKHVTCVSSAHESEPQMDTNPCHSTRLYLSTNGRNVKQQAKFDIVVAFMNFAFWQDFSLNITIPADDTPEKSPAAARPSEEINHQKLIMKSGDVCRILEWQRKLRSSLELRLELDHNCDLHKHRSPRPLPYAKARGKGLSLAQLLDSGQYDLTPKHKIMISFAVACSFWEFYGSEMMKARWRSDDIWFMSRCGEDQSNSSNVELKVFLSFAFGQETPGPPEVLEVDDLTHTYPQILSLGIILLEIGRGKSLGLPPLTANQELGEMRDDVNDAHSDASSQLVALENEVWETCKYKHAFDTAISNCLDPIKFIEKPGTRKQRSKLNSQDYEKLLPAEKVAENQKRLEYQKRAVQDRRDAIYHSVVSPLYWLAKVGNDDGNDDLCIKPRKQQSAGFQCPPTLSHDSQEAEMREHWKRVQSPHFMSNQSVDGNAESWFKDIQAISILISRQRRILDVRRGVKLPPTRIAILDTGCNLALKSFQKAHCFKGWEDFAGEPPSKTEVDEYGHGTFMARLLMQMVPGCELYIARIAQTARQLEHNEEVVAKAIKHASEVWEVDVISMSFGYPKFSQSIRNAIYEAKISRKDAIIFLASAGNDVNRSEAYPACDPSVISMYAARSTGAFLESNPIPSDGSRRLLGTYGDNIPEDVLAELREEYTEGEFSAGTSIATAVAAGVVGSMLAYAALLPHTLPGCGAEGLYSDLKTTDGMRQMLFGMAKSWNALQYFINPVLFWSYRQNDSQMYRGMCSAIPQKEVYR